MKYKIIGLGLIFLATAVQHGFAQSKNVTELPKNEFRGAWIATVVNLDWPTSRSTSTANQKSQLVFMLDKLKEAGINAVFFQVRSECDAMYDSPNEPWSYWLTGKQGKAPEPFYDPLKFAIEEAHKRGMELHAWFNPYRAVRGSGYTNDPGHVSVLHPEWILEFGSLKTLNPGIQEVRDYITTVISDVVRRYDIDGVHFDDYFYPYPPSQISSQDQETFNAHSRGFVSLGDWRRDNINLFVAQVADSIDVINPEVKFGISPFGIWKNGVPSGIVGLDAYNVIFGDATAWLDAKTIDYLTPQLYWPFGFAQDYGKLAPWWSEQTGDRHLYPGHGLYRSDRSTFSGTPFAADEVPRQVRFNRQNDKIQGSVFFRAKNITAFASKGFADTLRTDLYRYLALTPSMDWKNTRAPSAPTDLTFEWTGTDEVTLNWLPPQVSNPSTRRFAIYRVNFDDLFDLPGAISHARNIVGVTGETSIKDYPGIASEPYYYFVNSVSANSIESRHSNILSLEGRAVATERAQPVAFVLHQNYPNPFSSSTEIRYTLDRSATVTLRIHDVLGRTLATLVDKQWTGLGTYGIKWNGTNQGGQLLGSGTYFYTLEADNLRVSKGMVLIR